MQHAHDKSKDSAQHAISKHVAISPFKGKTGLRRLINAFGYSLEALRLHLYMKMLLGKKCY
jgi:hypothetical protein